VSLLDYRSKTKNEFQLSLSCIRAKILTKHENVLTADEVYGGDDNLMPSDARHSLTSARSCPELLTKPEPEAK